MRFDSWRQRACGVMLVAALQACGGGGGGGSGNSDAPVTPSGQFSQGARTVSPGVPVVIVAADGAVVKVTDSTAQVTLPPKAFVAYNDATQTVQGQIDVTVTPIAPSLDPAAMAGGSYVARVPGSSTQTQQIESFGAITVELTQGGQRVQLAPGKTATLRIPLDTRSTDRPATLPLYYWNETALVWIQEGTATLKTDAATGQQFYEGQVSHFSTWNADRPIDQSVEIHGCVESSAGIPAGQATYGITTDGQDYSGMARGSNTGGNFTVLAKKGGQVTLNAIYDGKMQSMDLGQLDGDTTVATCFVLDATTGVSATPEAFLNLIGTMVQAMGMSVAPGVLVDTTNLQPRAPGDVCLRGGVSNVKLGSAPVQGGEGLSMTEKHTLSARFDACVPVNDNAQFGTATQGPLTGDASTQFSYSVDPATSAVEVSMASTLSQLVDGQVNLKNTGLYDVILNQSPSAMVASITVHAGAAVTNLASGNTAVFNGGSMVLTTDHTRNVSSVTLNKLSYTLKGATYVLDGNGTGNSMQYTLRKNGAPAATLTQLGASFKVTGTVDPF